MRSARTSLAAIAVLAAVCLPAPAVAQLGGGRLAGVIRDDRGRPIRGATVTIESDAFYPKSFTGATDQKGRFSVLGLRRTTYTVTIRADGFESVAFEVAIPSMNATVPIDLRLMRALAPAPPPRLGGADAGKLQRSLDAAAALVTAGRTDAAIDAYRLILGETPALTSINLQLGYLFESRGDREAAIAAYDAALKSGAGVAVAGDALARLRHP